MLDGEALARLLRARPLPVHPGLLRAVVDATSELRLQPSPGGWVDLALGVPMMDTTRARAELDWSPRHCADAALLELLAGIRDGAGADTPTLHPSAGGPLRAAEFSTGVGAREQ